MTTLVVKPMKGKKSFIYCYCHDLRKSTKPSWLFYLHGSSTVPTPLYSVPSMTCLPIIGRPANAFIHSVRQRSQKMNIWTLDTHLIFRLDLWGPSFLAQAL